MRPSRIIAAVALAAAVAATGSYLAVATATRPSSASQPPATASPARSAPAGTRQPAVGPNLPPSTSGTSPSGGRPTPGRCAASALRGSVQGRDGAAGTIYTTIGLRNISATTCTVKGIPQVRLLDDQGQPVTAFGTCSSVRVRALEASTAPTVPTTPLVDRISDPQVAADRLVGAWLSGDQAAARKVSTSQVVVEQLFAESPPAHRPVAQPCRLADPGLYVCSYPLAEHAELSVFVVGGASVGYGARGVEFGD